MAFAAAQSFASFDPAARLARLRKLAWLIDASFSLPGTRFRFGLNSVIGLLPSAATPSSAPFRSTSSMRLLSLACPAQAVAHAGERRRGGFRREYSDRR